MKKENSVQYQESEAYNKNFPKLKDHLEYFECLYNFCFELHYMLNQKSFKDAGELLNGQMMILMRITDFLRCIGEDITKGYPEQAGTLAASIFELAHTGIYFFFEPEAVKKWFGGSKEDKMPKLIGKGTYKELVEFNCSKFNLDGNYEVQLYKELCWMKHSHPVMQDILINVHAQFVIGPYTDERAIHNSKLIIEQSGRLTEFLISHIQFPENFLSATQQELKHKKLVLLAQKRGELINTHNHSSS